MSIRVRFAPSPTGYLHIGGARTALFNWLIARKSGGTLILRIEDTDAARSSEEMVDGILEGLKWLGLEWDEGPYYQSERLNDHQHSAAHLLESGSAYACFCESTEEEVEGEWGHDPACRNRSPEERKAHIDRGEPYALRFRVPEATEIEFQDLVYGKVRVQTENLADFIILRSDATPTYHLSVVTDDINMGISHVIRGVDHLSNTTKHVLLFEALGHATPTFAHLPLILGADKKRLSKRHGATSVLQYRRKGFLPGALRNYLALLGWSPGDDREIFSDQVLIEAFDLGRVNKANAVFDLQKLEWINGKKLAETTAADLAPQFQVRLEEAGLWKADWAAPNPWLENTLEILKTRVRTLEELVDYGQPFFSDDFEYQADAEQKFLSFPSSEVEGQVRGALNELISRYEDLSAFKPEEIEQILRDTTQEFKLKTGTFFGVIRLALCGRAQAPGLFDVMGVLGLQRTLLRLKRLQAHLS